MTAYIYQQSISSGVPVQAEYHNAFIALPLQTWKGLDLSKTEDKALLVLNCVPNESQIRTNITPNAMNAECTWEDGIADASVLLHYYLLLYVMWTVNLNRSQSVALDDGSLYLKEELGVRRGHELAALQDQVHQEADPVVVQELPGAHLSQSFLLFYLRYPCVTWPWHIYCTVSRHYKYWLMKWYSLED